MDGLDEIGLALRALEFVHDIDQHLNTAQGSALYMERGIRRHCGAFQATDVGGIPRGVERCSVASSFKRNVTFMWLRLPVVRGPRRVRCGQFPSRAVRIWLRFPSGSLPHRLELSANAK